MHTSPTIPLIDISPIIRSNSSESERTAVIAQVRAACLEHGFFQITGHGVPVSSQREIIESSKRLFDLPLADKQAMSIKKNRSRRGYEGLGEQKFDGDVLPDQKEGVYFGPEESDQETGFLRGPNAWPNLPDDQFRHPFTEYYNHLVELGRTLWEILVVSLGHPPSVLNDFTANPIVFVRPIRYPAHTFQDPRQFGAAPHCDFGGLTILLQQPGKDGLEVWHEQSQRWIEVPAREDVFVVNLGNLIQKWTKGEYRSTLHRVINKVDGERYSVPCFWQGEWRATNPLLRPGEEDDGETVEEYIKSRLTKSFGGYTKTAAS